MLGLAPLQVGILGVILGSLLTHYVTVPVPPPFVDSDGHTIHYTPTTSPLFAYETVIQTALVAFIVVTCALFIRMIVGALWGAGRAMAERWIADIHRQSLALQREIHSDSNADNAIPSVKCVIKVDDVETDDETEQCVICKTNARMYALPECGHLCLCGSCAATIRSNKDSVYQACPCCRVKIVTEPLRIFR